MKKCNQFSELNPCKHCGAKNVAETDPYDCGEMLDKIVKNENVCVLFWMDKWQNEVNTHAEVMRDNARLRGELQAIRSQPTGDMAKALVNAVEAVKQWPEKHPEFLRKEIALLIEHAEAAPSSPDVAEYIGDFAFSRHDVSQIRKLAEVCLGVHHPHLAKQVLIIAANGKPIQAATRSQPTGDRAKALEYFKGQFSIYGDNPEHGPHLKYALALLTNAGK